jgi:hypothetical protein
MATRLFPVEFLCFGFDWPASLALDSPHIFINPDAGRSPLLVLGALPVPEGARRGARRGARLRMSFPARPRGGGRTLFRSVPGSKT